MEYKGASAYENDSFLEGYLTRRNRKESPNNSIEKPVLIELIGNVSGKRILDLGCGDAQIGYELIQQGCKSYVGVEGSLNMVKEAEKVLEGTKGIVHHSSMEEWSYPEGAFDLVISRLAFHYIENLQLVFNKVHSALGSNGEFVFSVQHPVLTSSTESASNLSKKTNWIVDDYFETGKRTEPWINKQVVKYHRTIEAYFKLLKCAGFKVKDLKECTPRKEEFEDVKEYSRRTRIPLFLMFDCKN